eukprot:jgi/Chlat1/4352/Chrsp29S00349
MSGSQDGDSMRILIATDNHLGYMERDEIRKDDSFMAFEEIFELAAKRKVDCVLLGGDLFHENKPSRSTLVRAIEILRRYCLNNQPVQFRVLSDQTVNFATKFACVNFEDPNFNVGLPVFSIHGNHDDPSGTDNLSAMDILSACNLVNYFGKTGLSGSGVGEVKIYPVLLQKGTTKVALYGLGNIRDERLNRMFQTPGAVKWVRAASSSGSDMRDWFNIFVLHQNRVHHSAKNAISERFLAKFIDFVIWGHEHECLVEPQESVESGCSFHVTQPGSSVATSLIEGEARKKHVLLLEVLGDKWRTEKVPLESVRPFEYEQVSLAAQPDLDPRKPETVQEFLDDKVNNMIARATVVPPSGQHKVLPLVRLRVDYTGFTTINPQRFGQKSHAYVMQVANPHDILLFTKSARMRTAAAKGGSEVEYEEGIRPEALDQSNIEYLMRNILHEQELEMFQEQELAQALHTFVEKEEKQALADAIRGSLDAVQASVVQLYASIAAIPLDDHEKDEDLNALISRAVQDRRAAKEADSVVNNASRIGSAATASAPSHGRTPAEGKPPAASGLRRGRGRQATLAQTFAGRDRSAASRQPVDGMDLDDGPPAPAPRGQGRAAAGAVLPSSRPKRAAATKATAVTAAMQDDEDDIQDDDDDDLPSSPEPTPRGRGRGRGGKRAAASTTAPRKRAKLSIRPSGNRGAGEQTAKHDVSSEEEEDGRRALNARSGRFESIDGGQDSGARSSLATRGWGTVRKTR